MIRREGVLGVRVVNGVRRVWGMEGNVRKNISIGCYFVFYGVIKVLF